MNPDLIGLTFDLSRKCTGVVKWLGSHPVTTATVELDEAPLGGQLVTWRFALVELLNRHNPDWVAYEDARAVSKQHGMILFGMTGILLAECWERGIQAVPVNQMTAKKTLTGTGRATKGQMLDAARSLYPELEISTHDVADAVAVGLHVIRIAA